MAQPPTVIVSGGGLRSLTATALTLSEADPQDIVLVHLHDGRANAGQRAEHMRLQAAHYRINRLVDIDLPYLQSTPFVPVNQDGGASPLIRPQTLLVALGQAIRLKAQRLIWPVQINADYPTVARATEATRSAGTKALFRRGPRRRLARTARHRRRAHPARSPCPRPVRGGRA